MLWWVWVEMSCCYSHYNRKNENVSEKEKKKKKNAHQKAWLRLDLLIKKNDILPQQHECHPHTWCAKLASYDVLLSFNDFKYFDGVSKADYQTYYNNCKYATWNLKNKILQIMTQQALLPIQIG